MKQYKRAELISKFKKQIANRDPIIVGGAGYGLMAKAAEAGGIDLLMAYNTGPYRMDGHVSLTGYRPYSDSNADTLWLGHTIGKVTDRTPVVGGIGPTDPYRNINHLIDEMMELGFSGVTNVPSNFGSNGGYFGNVITEYGMALPADVELAKLCDKKDVFTMFYAFSEDALKQLIAAGVDAVSVHVGGTSGGTTGAGGNVTRSMEAACEMTQHYYDLAMKENPEIIILTHGGPFENPETVKRCFETTQIHGFIGASSVERLPVEKEILKVVKEYKSLKLR